MTTILLVCETCGYDASQPDAVRPGESLAQLLEHTLAEQDESAPRPVLQRFRCLMACKRACAVQVRAPDKMGYVLGDFEPDAVAVEALLAYCEKHHASASGQVAYQEWPEAIKGKFVARIPPV